MKPALAVQMPKEMGQDRFGAGLGSGTMRPAEL